MTPELKFLAYTLILGLAHVLVAGLLATQVRGLKWNAGNRDEQTQPLEGAPARAERASKNFLETFPFFAAAVFAVELAHVNSAHTALGAEIYFWARVAYLPIYVIGIPYLRTLVWAIAFWGLLQLLEALL